MLQLEKLQSINFELSQQFWGDVILHSAHRTKSRKSCNVLHNALRHTDLQKSPFFFCCLAERPPAGVLLAEKKGHFVELGWTVDSKWQQEVFLPSELSAYPDFKTHHLQMPNDCLASKKNHIEQKLKTAKSSREQSRRRYLVYLCIL